jgi:hypothetical protein
MQISGFILLFLVKVKQENCLVDIIIFVVTKKTINKKSIAYKTVRFLGSNTFLYIVLGIFLIQAIWIAISVAYPMLFDEHYHIGVISIYSEQLSPFIREQDVSITSFYGEISRNPSYLYHYLLSFPYRLITSFTDSFYLQIVIMRLINVLFVTVGLIYFRKLSIKIGLSKAIANISLLIISLVPVFILLAAHINYDNLIFMLVPIFLLKGIKLIGNKNSLELYDLNTFVLVGVVGSVVKSAFLPIFIAGVVYVFIKIALYHRHKIIKTVHKSYKKLSLFKKVLVIFMALLSVGLLGERYIGNVVYYGALSPKCSQVQDPVDCSKQYLQIREENFKRIQEQTPKKTDNFFEYSAESWIPRNINSSLTVSSNIGAPESLERELDWQTKRAAPIKILKNLVWTLFCLSIIFLVYSFRDIKNKPYFWFIATILLTYLFALWYYTNFLNYKELGVAIAIQSRYLLIILPILIGYILMSVNEAISSRSIKLLLFSFVCLFFTQGGGALTIIINADSNWYWQRSYIIEPNEVLKEALKPLIKEN